MIIQWENYKTLITPRILLDFTVGLIKGVGKYFNEKLAISRAGENSIRIVFP